MSGALAFLLEFLPQVPTYISAGAQLVHVLQNGMDMATRLRDENRFVTPADWDDVNASIAAKRERLHAP